MAKIKLKTLRELEAQLAQKMMDILTLAEQVSDISLRMQLASKVTDLSLVAAEVVAFKKENS